MLSELILFGTLLVNAAAILNFKLKRREDEGFSVGEPTFGDKVRDFLHSLQYFRIFIAMWNVLVMFLMLVFFGH